MSDRSCTLRPAKRRSFNYVVQIFVRSNVHCKFIACWGGVGGLFTVPGGVPQPRVDGQTDTPRMGNGVGPTQLLCTGRIRVAFEVPGSYGLSAAQGEIETTPGV